MLLDHHVIRIISENSTFFKTLYSLNLGQFFIAAFNYRLFLAEDEPDFKKSIWISSFDHDAGQMFCLDLIFNSSASLTHLLVLEKQLPVAFFSVSRSLQEVVSLCVTFSNHPVIYAAHLEHIWVCF